MSKDGYQAQAARDWREAMHDSGSEDWRTHWFVDGERADIRNTPQGMVFSAGPVARDDGSHAVLWTHQDFAGDLRIRLRFTRLDTITRFVNILYIQATGSGEDGYTEDITEWSDDRQIPYMFKYFNTMNLLHISYAAFGNADDKDEDYVRARRYPTRPDRAFNQTDIPPDNFLTGLFRPGVSYDFDVIKTDADLWFRVSNAAVDTLFHWPLAEVAPLTHGRIGIRHMWTRCSRYADIRIATAE
jgi:hypothetical protein